MHHVQQLTIAAGRRGLHDITGEVTEVVAHSGVDTGLCTVFVQHTSASLVIQENADPTACADLEAYLTRLVPDGDPRYAHSAEGPDDMAAHIRTALTRTSEQIPIVGGRLGLGTWQGLYLWEHRYRHGSRRVLVHVSGE